MVEEESITYLVGNELSSGLILEPYNSLVCEFLDELSSILRADDRAREYPDVMAFSFWCRKANILQKKLSFGNSELRLGLGLVLHIAPSNVPINFAFSFIFGLLSGNSNIVRVPSKKFPQIDIICDCLTKLFTNERYQTIKKMTALVRYGHIDEINSLLSSRCDARLVWGGDETIKSFRRFSMPIRSVEIDFSDRYSICIINVSSLNRLDESEIKRLAEGFYNDTYLMDQNACSSPHLVIWLNDKEKSLIKERFWSAVSDIASNKYHLELINAVDKYTLLCSDAIDLGFIGQFRRHLNHVYRVVINSLPKNTEDLRGKYGYFYEYDADNLDELAGIVNRKYQTITYFGIDKEKLRKIVIENQLQGIDRIVPIGKALDIDIIWDGYDIVRSLSRIIDVR